jgi:guanine nucleotide-binding protein subunit alpha/guanine nucleotide-binding protein G(t) subunit alpha 3
LVIYAATLSQLQEIGEELSEIGTKLDYPLLNKERVQDVRKLWQDPAIQVKNILNSFKDFLLTVNH